MASRKEQRSLFGEILDWMLAPLLLLWPMSLGLTGIVAQEIANRPYDRDLGESTRLLARQVQIIPGRNANDLPMVSVQAARALGQRGWKIIFRHILPNAAAPILVTAVLGVPEAILAEAGLSFLGFGVQPPQATWGNIIADGKTYILDAWWLILFPGLAILLAALSFYLTGDALRQAVETRSERQ